MDALTEIVKQLGFWGLLIILSLPVLVLSLVVALRGFSWGGHVVLRGLLSSADTSAQDTPSVVSEYYHEVKLEDDESIGFELPKPHVRIWGMRWNKEHTAIYRLLEDRWRQGTSVDLTECNVTSSLVSLLEDKYEKFGALTIYVTEEQSKLLNYLKQYQGINFEIR